MNDPNSTVILTQLWNSQTTCRTNGPSATYSRIPSLDDVICGNSSGFRLRCRRNRFLFMTEYRTDGRRSVSAGRSSCLFSLFLSLSFLLSEHVCVSLFHRWNLSFFQRDATPRTGGRRRWARAEGNTMKTKRFFLYFSFEVDPLRRIRVKSLVTWIDNVASNGGCGGN